MLTLYVAYSIYILFLYIQAQAQIYKHNLLSSFFVGFLFFFLYAVSELSTKFWTTSKEAHPQERLILFSAIILSLPAVLCVCVGDPLKISPFHTSMFMDKPLCVLVHVTVTHCLVIFVVVCCLVTAYLVSAAISTGRCFAAAFLILCLHDLSVPSSMTAPEPQMQNSEDDG